MRVVFEDDAGQYVIGDDGENVHGQWLMPADEPVTAKRRAQPPSGQ